MGKKKYEGSVYIGVVGPETEIGECTESIMAIARRGSDTAPRFVRATKGYEARERHFTDWLVGKHDFMLLLDHDMVFESDTLERLLSHGKPYVSGFYMRRRVAPIVPIWFKPWRGKWPFDIWTDIPTTDKLHHIGASGWGCILIHRAVAEAVRPLLKGEPFVIEDDMDLWPYDIGAIMESMRKLREAHGSKLGRANIITILGAELDRLESEIRPIRGVKDIIGSDIRFPWYAREAGFKLYGDAAVQCAHVLNYPLAPFDYAGMPQKERDGLMKGLKKERAKERKRIRERLAELNGEGGG